MKARALPVTLAMKNRMTGQEIAGMVNTPPSPAELQTEEVACCIASQPGIALEEAGPPDIMVEIYKLGYREALQSEGEQ